MKAHTAETSESNLKSRHRAIYSYNNVTDANHIATVLSVWMCLTPAGWKHSYLLSFVTWFLGVTCSLKAWSERQNQLNWTQPIGRPDHCFTPIVRMRDAYPRYDRLITASYHHHHLQTPYATHQIRDRYAVNCCCTKLQTVNQRDRQQPKQREGASVSWVMSSVYTECVLECSRLAIAEPPRWFSTRGVPCAACCTHSRARSPIQCCGRNSVHLTESIRDPATVGLVVFVGTWARQRVQQYAKHDYIDTSTMISRFISYGKLATKSYRLQYIISNDDWKSTQDTGAKNDFMKCI